MSIVVDPATGDPIYTSADFHRPWASGDHARSGHPGRASTQLNALLQPILGTVIGSVDQGDPPRADQCGRADGRLCESLVGNVVTDAMRDRYASIGVQFAHHELGRPPRPVDLPGRRGGTGLLPGLHASRRS